MVSATVIIPTCDRRETLLACLRSLAAQSVPGGTFDVIVVDDGSSDGTEGFIASHAGALGLRLTLLRQERRGPGAARNLGAREATGEILAFTEDDVTLDPRWLERGLAPFDDAQVAAVEGRTLLSGGGSTLRLLETGRQLGFIPCNFFVRAAEFRAVGGYSGEYFDADSRLYFREDADFGFKLLERGRRVVFAEEAVVTHPPLYGSASGYLRHARRYRFDPLLYREHPALYRSMIEVKHLGPLTIRRPFHYLCALAIVATLAALLGPSPWHWAAVLAALGAYAALWYRYERRDVHVSRAGAILILPYVYWAGFLAGCVRYRSFGAVL